MVLRATAGVFLTVVLVVGCGAQSPSTPPSHKSSTQRIAPSSSLPAKATVSSDPAPSSTSSTTKVLALSPGQTYQLLVSIPLLESMSREDTTKRYILPSGGYFQCVRKETQRDSTWYYVQIRDATGNVYGGYLDGEQLQEGKLKPYTASQAVTLPRSQEHPNAQSPRVNNAYAAPAPVASQGEMVYVAPDSGKKYHFNRTCRGLNNAGQVISMTIEQARGQGYDACGICGKGR